MTLAILDARDKEYVVVAAGADLIATYVQQAIAAGQAAQAVLDAILAAGLSEGVFPSLAAGESGTAPGQYFWVGEGGTVTLYLNDAGTGSEVAELATAAGLALKVNTVDLEAPTGADLVGTEAGGTLAAAAPLSINTTDGADISARLAAAIALAGGKRIVIPPGSWTAKNVDVTGATIEFTEGAVVSMTLGSSENGFTTDGGTTLIRPNIVLTNTGAPTDGGVGNPITMGTYVTTGDEFNGLEIVDGTFTSENASAWGIAISCLGRCQRVYLRGTTTLRGRFGGGFQAHWGGEFVGDPHTSDVTASYHPNDIVIETLVLEQDGGLGGHLGLSLSAAYNVNVGTIINRGWERTDWIQPGDVYDLVAAADQRDKIMSGIRVGYTEVVNPVQNSSGYSNVLVSGVSATIRTVGQTEQVSAADRQNMRVDHGEIRFICEAAHTYDTDPLARLLYANDSRMSVTFEGFPANASSLAQSVQSTDCELSVKGKGAARALIAHSNIRNAYRVEWDTETAAGSIATTHRVVALGTTAWSATVDGAVAVGGTSVTISAWTGPSASLVIKGTRVYLTDTQFLTLSRSQTIGAGVASIDVDPAPFTVSAAATLSFTCRELDSEVRGYIDRAYIALELANTDGVKVPATCYRSARHDALHTGVTNRRWRYNGVYDRCGQIGSGSLYNINLGGAGVLSYGGRIVGAKFEASGTALVSSNVYGRSTNNAHVALMVTDCDLNSTSHPINYLWPTDAATLNAGPPQVFGNRRLAGMSATGYDFDISSGATMQVGAAFHIWRTALPGAGTWPTTSRWFNPAAAAGVSPGSVRTAAGTWVAEPVL